MVVAMALAWWLQAGQIENLPYKFPDMIFAGEREVVLGPLPYRDTVMPMYYSKETYPDKPNNVYGGPAWNEYSLGTIRWSVRSNTFAQKPCFVVRCIGLYTPQTTYTFNRFKKVTDKVTLTGVLEYWLDPDGTILRQYEEQTDRRGTQTATCTYYADSINVQLEQFGKRTVTTVYPGDMDKLQAQFKPMILNGRVALREKEYVVFEPFTGGYTKRKARITGHFDGSYLGIKFHGTHVDMDGFVPEGPIKVYVDDENDLVQVDLPNDRYIKLGVPPPGKDK